MGIMREFLDECDQSPSVLRVFLSDSAPLRSTPALRLWMNARGAESLRKTRRKQKCDAPVPRSKCNVITYLRMGGWKAGLLISFNVPALRDGIWCPPSIRVHSRPTFSSALVGSHSLQISISPTLNSLLDPDARIARPACYISIERPPLRLSQKERVDHAKSQ
jgi:hypothetical protein